jgi:hypothetical protein
MLTKFCILRFLAKHALDPLPEEPARDAVIVCVLSAVVCLSGFGENLAQGFLCMDFGIIERVAGFLNPRYGLSEMGELEIR